VVLNQAWRRRIREVRAHVSLSGSAPPGCDRCDGRIESAARLVRQQYRDLLAPLLIQRERQPSHAAGDYWAPLRIGYNLVPFQVQTPDALNIQSVVLVKPGSDTHAYDMEQRLVGLPFTPTSGALTVTAPPNSNVAPPGYYMLFVLNRAGVPSVARFVQVSQNPTDQLPKGTITAPSGDVTIKAGQAVNFAGTATDADGSVKTYSWFFPEGTPDSSTMPNPGAIVFPNAGTYVVSLTVVDDKGVNDPSPPTRTVTVQP
jgi:hypothetical protein